MIQSEAIIQIEVREATEVGLSLLNLNGQKVQNYLKDTFLEEGMHQLQFVRGNLPTGIYFMQLRSEKGLVTKKLLIQ